MAGASKDHAVGRAWMEHDHGMNASALRLALVVATGLGTCAVVAACSSSTTAAPANLSFSSAAAVTGLADNHCAGKLVTVDPAVCHVVASEDAGQTQRDAGDTDGGATGTPDYGPTQPGSFRSNSLYDVVYPGCVITFDIPEELRGEVMLFLHFGTVTVVDRLRRFSQIKCGEGPLFCPASNLDDLWTNFFPHDMRSRR